MAPGLIGIKVGTSRLFHDDGNSMLVTVVQVNPNLVCQVKTQEKDGYSAIQLAYGTQKPQRLSKALRGHYAKNKVPVARSLDEIRISQKQEADFNIGDKINVSQFVAGQRVDATGVSKGKGFAGAVKRWNFSMQDATHGNSISHRHLGSTGQCQWPGKVWKGKKMAGQYGNKRITAVRLKVAKVDEENDAIFIAGAIPGAPGTKVIIKPAVKQSQEELNFVAKKLEELANQAEVAQEAANTPVADEPVVEEKQADTPAADAAAEEKQAAAPVADATEEEKQADAPVADATEEEKQAGAPVADATEEEKQADAPVADKTAEPQETATDDAPAADKVAEDKDNKESKDES